MLVSGNFRLVRACRINDLVKSRLTIADVKKGIISKVNYAQKSVPDEI